MNFKPKRQWLGEYCCEADRFPLQEPPSPAAMSWDTTSTGSTSTRSDESSGESSRHQQRDGKLRQIKAKEVNKVETYIIEVFLKEGARSTILRHCIRHQDFLYSFKMGLFQHNFTNQYNTNV